MANPSGHVETESSDAGERAGEARADLAEDIGTRYQDLSQLDLRVRRAIERSLLAQDREPRCPMTDDEQRGAGRSAVVLDDPGHGDQQVRCRTAAHERFHAGHREGVAPPHCRRACPIPGIRERDRGFELAAKQRQQKPIPLIPGRQAHDTSIAAEREVTEHGERGADYLVERHRGERAEAAATGVGRLEQAIEAELPGATANPPAHVRSRIGVIADAMLAFRRSQLVMQEAREPPACAGDVARQPGHRRSEGQHARSLAARVAR
jgi:hypothetical protein